MAPMYAMYDVRLMQVSLYDTITEMALSSRAYRYKAGMTRRPNQQLKWLLPAVLAAQVSACVVGVVRASGDVKER